MQEELPHFPYFPDPLANGCIIEKQATCPCCGEDRSYMYVGPIYSAEVDDETEACPWCIADGSAAAKWSAEFNDVLNLPQGVPDQVAEIIKTRTPGYETWQGNRWLFSETDALIFFGEVVGADLLEEGNQAKIEACLAALSRFNLPKGFCLSEVKGAGEPALYLFQDRDTLAFRAYADWG